MNLRVLFTLLFTVLLFSLSGQKKDQTEIIAVIDQMFDGMRANDSMMLIDLFTPEASLASIFINPKGEVIKRPGNIKGFITAVGRPHDEMWDERIWSYDIKIDNPMAQAWTEYTFYLGDRLSHCGVNVFEMIKLESGWKISGITDTRRKTGCTTKEESDINEIMDQWHHAAAVADEDAFFGSMTENGIYIGTDATERWTRNEMKNWAQKYFERESAWSFTPLSRNISFSEDRTIAWFDELLDTWMGSCRGSGVLVLTEMGWKIQHWEKGTQESLLKG